MNKLSKFILSRMLAWKQTTKDSVTKELTLHLYDPGCIIFLSFGAAVS